jgi:uroporphyrinogen-III synthase
VDILVTRPLPGGDATARRLRALGHRVTLAPLMATEAVAWSPPATPPSAIMLTSGFAARLSDASAFHTLPTFAVGAATARAAHDAGFTDVRDGGGTAQALLDRAAAAGFGDILHLAGADRVAVTLPAGLRVTTCIVYRARLLPLDAAPVADWVLLYSPRAAAHFAAEVDRTGQTRAGIAIAAISAAALAAAGPGWRAARAAAHPDEDALLAAIGISWQ